MKDQLQGLDQEKKVGRTLVMEFSIKNIQVVRRHVEWEDGIRQVRLAIHLVHFFCLTIILDFPVETPEGKALSCEKEGGCIRQSR